MIKSVDVSGVATFNDGPHIIEGFSKINYFYGQNGTGKTTISRVLANPMLNSAQSRVQWADNIPLLIKVYNQDFINKNFSSLSGVKGIFTMGEGNADTHREILEKRRERDAVDVALRNLNANLNGGENVSVGAVQKSADAVKVLEGACWQIYTGLDPAFSQCFSGYKNKAKFAANIREVYKLTGPEPASLDALRNEAMTVFDTAITEHEIIFGPSFEDIIALGASPILGKVVVGRDDVDIAALIKRLGNSDWVKEGIGYLNDGEGRCPFCQQTIEVQALRGKLDAFFDESYLRDLDEAKRLSDSYRKGFEHISASIEKIHESGQGFFDEDEFQLAVNRIETAMTRNMQKIESKVATPSVPIALEDISGLAEGLSKIIQKANSQIKERNELVRGRDARKATLIKDVWRRIVEDNRLALRTMIKTVDDCAAAEKALRDKIDAAINKRTNLDADLSRLNGQLVSVIPTIDSINEILRAFDFEGFRLERESDSTYRIVRKTGEQVDEGTLSEGEKSFLTFLYFYHLVKGGVTTEEVGKKKVVVFDDPVSSLDGDILFIVATLIKDMKERIAKREGDIRQVIVLTHNVFFHKEVSFNPKGSSCNTAGCESFWVVRKNAQTSWIVHSDENPISSEYEYLWKVVRDSDDNSSVHMIRNVMRRILEYYFKVLGGERLDDVMDKLEETDRVAGRALMMWLHAGSHIIDDPLFCSVTTETVAMYKRVFQRIFNVKNHMNHYNMMMRIQE